MILSVNILAMCALENRHDLAGIVDFIDDTIPSNSNSPAHNVMQLATSSRPRGSPAIRICDFGSHRIQGSSADQSVSRQQAGLRGYNSLTASFTFDPRNGFVERNCDFAGGFCFLVFADGFGV